MKKASIITLQYIDNYGSVLQTFATQEIVKRYGYEGEVVNYTRENCSYDFQKKAALERYRSRKDFLSFYPCSKLLQLRWSFIYKKRNKVFEKFRQNYLNLTKEYTSLEELKSNPPLADIYITGSDQVWNTEYNGGVLGEYFLEYAPNHAKKIALSASMGIEEISDEEKEKIKNYVDDYCGISVRENSALRILEDVGYKNAVHVIDPTLMLTKDEWIKRLKLKCTESKHVLLYQLNENAEMVELATQIAKDNNLELLIISATCKRVNCNYKVVKNCSPQKFVELVYNAQYIITDSFHGTAFSFNFNKDVFVFYPPRYNTRIKSFLKLLNEENRLIENRVNWKNVKKSNFDKVNMVLEYERKKVSDFLEKYI